MNCVRLVLKWQMICWRMKHWCYCCCCGCFYCSHCHFFSDNKNGVAVECNKWNLSCSAGTDYSQVKWYLLIVIKSAYAILITFIQNETHSSLIIAEKRIFKVNIWEMSALRRLRHYRHCCLLSTYIQINWLWQKENFNLLQFDRWS